MRTMPLLPMDEPETEEGSFVFSGSTGTSVLMRIPKKLILSHSPGGHVVRVLLGHGDRIKAAWDDKFMFYAVFPT